MVQFDVFDGGDIGNINDQQSHQRQQHDDDGIGQNKVHNHDHDPEDIGLLNERRKSRRAQLQAGYYYDNASVRHLASSTTGRHNMAVDEWQRPYWLGSTLFFILLAFWLLDSLKDPLFARLVDGKIGQHQPTAKLVSVVCTLLLVCALEYIQNLRQQYQHEQQLAALAPPSFSSSSMIMSHDKVLDPGGIWNRMPMMIGRLVGRGRAGSGGERQNSSSPKADTRWRQLDDRPPATVPSHALDDIVSVGIFYQIGLPYVVAFSVIGYLILKFEQQQQSDKAVEDAFSPSSHFDDTQGLSSTTNEWNRWYILGYALYIAVESFGSLAVATFWSYANSTLALDDAEQCYGPIIATAQLGAIAGSTLVATGRWDAPVLFAVVSMTIVLQLVVIKLYDRKFPPTSLLLTSCSTSLGGGTGGRIAGNTIVDDAQTVLTWQDNNATITKPFWSGLYLIVRHSYVLLILGVSCLYEISMTLLDYQMKLLGFARFDSNENGSKSDRGDIGEETAATATTRASMSFSEFMGRYGQVVNFTSLLFSSIVFPWLIKRFGLRRTLMVFPTFLLLVTFLAYGAVPGNLAVLFISLSLLKAMTYSIHDPSKELLYIPTSNAVKFRAKFWIDVVGERISKAIGSAFNTLANDVEQSVKIGSVPSILSSLGLWLACYYVGKQFDKLLATGKIVGLENGVDPSTYTRVPRTDSEHDDGEDNGDHSFTVDDSDRHSTGEPSEVDVMFEEQSHISTLDLMADPVSEATASHNRQREGLKIELPSLSWRI